MNREAAIECLGVSAVPAAAEVRTRYQELLSDFQIRLANAPTPALRTTYSKNMAELLEAAQALVPGFEMDNSLDLPSAVPRKDVPLPTSLDLPVVRRPSNQMPELILPLANTGLPRSIIAASIVALCSLGLALSFALQLRQHKAPEQTDQLAELHVLKAYFENAPLSVCNASTHSVVVKSLISTYMKDGRLNTFNSSAFGWPSWEVRPGSTRKLELVRGVETVWDGSTLYYSLNVDYQGSEWLIGGFWRDLAGECVKIALDQDN